MSAEGGYGSSAENRACCACTAPKMLLSCAAFGCLAHASQPLTPSSPPSCPSASVALGACPRFGLLFHVVCVTAGALAQAAGLQCDVMNLGSIKNASVSRADCTVVISAVVSSVEEAGSGTGND